MKKLLPLLALATICTSAHGSIVINLFAGELKDSANANLQTGALIQLVNLGTDGIFNAIDLNDGSVSSLTQWVSGDDSLINVPFVGGTTAAAFAMPDSSGILNGVFEFATGAVPAGTKIGLRWFSDVLASNFATTILGSGNRYGQYTLQGVAQGGGLHSGDSWVAPSDGGNVTFDSFATASITGNNPDAAGRASIAPVPEPTSAFLVAVGAAGLMVRRRRQS
jgi:hypothetical protein